MKDYGCFKNWELNPIEDDCYFGRYMCNTGELVAVPVFKRKEPVFLHPNDTLEQLIPNSALHSKERTAAIRCNSVVYKLATLDVGQCFVLKPADFNVRYNCISQWHKYYVTELGVSFLSLNDRVNAISFGNGEFDSYNFALDTEVYSYNPTNEEAIPLIPFMV